MSVRGVEHLPASVFRLSVHLVVAGCLMLCGAMPLHGQPLPPDEELPFEAVIERIRELNVHGPDRVGELARLAREHLDDQPDLHRRILFATALAPSDALQRGYRPARQRLLELLTETRQSGDRHVLFPELRLALSDLAHRHGYARQAFLEILSARERATPETPYSLRHRINVMAAAIHTMTDDPYFARYVIASSHDSGGADHPCRFFMCRFILAEALWWMGEYAEMDAVLNQASMWLEDGLREELLTMLWIEKAWHALGTGHETQARKYLEAALKTHAGELPVLLEAETAVLRAVLDHVDGFPEAAVMESLKNARLACARAAFPARYDQLLAKSRALFDRLPGRSGGLVFLKALSQSGSDENILLSHTRMLAARAELKRLQGDTEAAAGLLLEAMRLSTHFNRRMAGLRTEWLAGMPGPAAVKNGGRFPPDQSHLYYWITLVLLVVLLVVAIIRIRFQFSLNRELETALKRAKLAEEAAEESSRMKARFLANISHEIKTPMSGLVGMASLLDELVTDPVQRKYLGTIRTCSENLLVLMNDLLDLGRVDSGKIQIENRPFRLREVVDHCLELARQEARNKPLDIRLDWGDGTPETVTGDGSRITQVLGNLLGNAIKYSEKGHVTLSTGFRETLGSSGILEVRIADSGIGIPKDRIAGVFEPFSRVEEPHLVRKEGGSGLGLAICRKLVHLMGGQILLESEPGVGTTFTVAIPVRIGDHKDTAS